MSIRTSGRRRARAAAVLSLALAAMLVPTAAHAAETPGGTRDAPVPAPVTSFDASFEASNAHVTSNRDVGQEWYNVAWYSVTPSQDVDVSVHTLRTGQPWDPTIEVWQGNDLLGSNDDWVGRDAGLGVRLTAGTTYLIGLGGYSSDHRGTATLYFTTQLPATPTIAETSAYDGGVQIEWEAADPAAGVGRYVLLCAPVGEELEECEEGYAADGAVWASGLTNGVEYTFRIVARNRIGDSGPSADVTATPRVPTVTTIATSPEALVAGEPFDVVVEVLEDSWCGDGGDTFARDMDDEPTTCPAAGEVDVVVGGTAYDDVELVDGVAVVEGVTAPGGSLTITAHYTGRDGTASSSAQLDVDVARRTDTVTLTVPPLTLGQQVRDAATSAAGLPVTLAATGACTVTDGVLTATGAGECVVTATTAGDRDHEPASASVTVAVTAPASAFTFPTGLRPAPGTTVTVSGAGLQPGSAATLVVHSTPRTIATAVVAADGSVVLTGVVPADLEAGAHRLVANGTALDGTPLTGEVAFTVAAAGERPDALATTGAEPGSTAGLAAVWVLLGAGLMLVARRRTAHV